MKLYHLIPAGMQGSVLYPLSTLQTNFPDLYAKRLEEYGVRAHVIRNPIDLLECIWADTIMLSPIHPQHLNMALKAAGHKGLDGRRAYVVESKHLDQACLAVGEFIERDMKYGSFDSSCNQRYSRFPQGLIEYYRNEVNRARDPFIFQGVTHVFYKGNIDISLCPVIEIRP